MVQYRGEGDVVADARGEWPARLQEILILRSFLFSLSVILSPFVPSEVDKRCGLFTEVGILFHAAHWVYSSFHDGCNLQVGAWPIRSRVEG